MLYKAYLVQFCGFSQTVHGSLGENEFCCFKLFCNSEKYLRETKQNCENAVDIGTFSQPKKADFNMLI